MSLTPAQIEALKAKLVSYWKFDENSWTTAFDSVGSNDWTANNSRVIWNAWKINNGADFTQGNDWITVSHNSSLNITSAITIGWWIKTSSLTTTQYILNKRVFNSVNWWELTYAVSGKCFVRFNQGSVWNTFRLDSVSNYTTDWQFWVATYDWSTIRLYINWTLDASQSASFTIGTNTTVLYIGRDEQSVFSNLLLDEAFIANQALNADEVSFLYNNWDWLQYPFDTQKPAWFLMRNF